jgi:hypothetical protein
MKNELKQAGFEQSPNDPRQWNHADGRIAFQDSGAYSDIVTIYEADDKRGRFPKRYGNRQALRSALAK